MERKLGGGCKLWILFLIFTVGHVQSAVEYVETGTGHTFRPSVTGKPESILWKYNKNKLVEFDGSETTWYRFKGRGNLNQTGELQLQQLFKNESGSYQADIQVNGRIQSASYDVKVIDAVSTPEVKCEVNDEEIKLTCSANSATIFKWDEPESFKSTKATITVPKGTDQKSVYICTAENELGSTAVKSTDFSLKTCFTDKGNNTAVTVTVVLLLLIMIVIGIVGFLFWKRMKNNKGPTEPNGQQPGNDVSIHILPAQVKEKQQSDASLQNKTQDDEQLEEISTEPSPSERDPLLTSNSIMPKEVKDAETAEDEGLQNKTQDCEQLEETSTDPSPSERDPLLPANSIMPKEDEDTEKTEDKGPESASENEGKQDSTPDIKADQGEGTAGRKADGDQNLSTPLQNMSQPKFVGNDYTRGNGSV